MDRTSERLGQCYVRDVEFLIAMRLQTWSRGFTPRHIVGYRLPRAIDVDIRIGEVIAAGRPGGVQPLARGVKRMAPAGTSPLPSGRTAPLASTT